MTHDAPQTFDPSASRAEFDAVQRKQVIVIGGGLSGITAALALADHGYAVSLLEARGRLGGRVGSFDDQPSGQTVDYCQHVGMGCCTNLIQLLQQLQIADAWDRQETLHFFSHRGLHLPLRASPFPAPFHLTGLLTGWPDLSLSDRFRVAWGLLQLLRWKPSGDDRGQRALDWLRSHGQTERCLSRFWETILVSALGDQIDRLSLHATRQVLVEGFAANRSAYHLLVPRQPLSQLIGSQAEKVLIARGVTIRLASPAKRLLWNHGYCCGVELADRSTLDSERIVVAVPWHQVARLFTWENELPADVVAWLETIQSISSSPITGIHTWWDRPWLDAPHAILADRFCQWVFAHPNNESTSSGEIYYQIVISGSRSLPRGDSQSILDAVTLDLQAVFPRVRQAKLLRGKVVTDPNAVFSIAGNDPMLRPRCQRFAERRLWLCGDWTETDWPATMEGAIRSGYSVADSIAAQDGHHAPSLAPDLDRGWLARRLIRR